MGYFCILHVLYVDLFECSVCVSGAYLYRTRFEFGSVVQNKLAYFFKMGATGSALATEHKIKTKHYQPKITEVPKWVMPEPRNVSPLIRVRACLKLFF